MQKKRMKSKRMQIKRTLNVTGYCEPLLNAFPCISYILNVLSENGIILSKLDLCSKIKQGCLDIGKYELSLVSFASYNIFI